MFGAPSNAIDFAAAFTSLRAEADAYGALTATSRRPTPTAAALNWSASTVNPYLRLTCGTNVWRAHRRPVAPHRHDHLPLDAVRRDAADRRHGLDDAARWKAPNFSGIGIARPSAS